MTSDRTGQSVRVAGRELLQEWNLTLPQRRSSDLIHYRCVGAAAQ